MPKCRILYSCNRFPKSIWKYQENRLTEVKQTFEYNLKQSYRQSIISNTFIDKGIRGEEGKILGGYI